MLTNRNADQDHAAGFAAIAKRFFHEDFIVAEANRGSPPQLSRAVNAAQRMWALLIAAKVMSDFHIPGDI